VSAPKQIRIRAESEQNQSTEKSANALLADVANAALCTSFAHRCYAAFALSNIVYLRRRSARNHGLGVSS
jgi:hypothetical protein